MKSSDLTLHDSVASFLRAAPKRGPRIPVFDIETFPMLSYHWRMWKQNISTLQVVEDISMMSFAAKWLGQPDAFYTSMRGAGKRMRDDIRLLRPLHRLLSNVDMVVAHNGHRFDLPVIRARMAERQLSPLPPIKVIDTYQLNKQAFGFSSQSLAHISPKFTDDGKTEHKQFPGFHLWLACMQDDPEAWDECETYNLTDCTSLEEVYMKCRGWYQGAPNVGPYFKDIAEGEHVCDTCGSTNVRVKGTRKTQVGIYKRYRCLDCGHWSRGRLLVANRAQRAHILMS